MATNPPTLTPAADEKIVPLMVYTSTGVARGEMILKQTIRVNTWLRSAGASDYLQLYNTQVLTLGLAGRHQTHSLPEYLIPAPSIITVHTLPPVQESVDYDPSEPNRKMEPVSLFFGSFRINGQVRMSAATTLGVHLSTAKETFLTIYDCEITNPEIPNMGTVKAPMVYLRPAAVAFSPRKVG